MAYLNESSEKRGLLGNYLQGKQIISIQVPFQDLHLHIFSPKLLVTNLINFFSIVYLAKEFFPVHESTQTCIFDNLSCYKAFHFDLPKADKYFFLSGNTDQVRN